MADTGKRPSPDALLEAAQREGRGALKIFLGAAPGVGKTYAMLQQARERRLGGEAVIVGVVETHGRAETDALTRGFDIIPKKRALYKGRIVAEMDLDAILTRKPSLVLVDELAHTNAPGSRHPKRYMDVEEILAAGIDVYTTLNIQHVDSLNDVVARITRIRVRETVPDRLVDDADEIELADLTADDLIERLNQGKVYVKAQAERAIKHYFAPGNLAALRELALRKAAQHVDREMVGYMKSHAVEGPWPAAERILVCIGEHPSSAELVRRARRLADSMKASWIALHIESPSHANLSETERDHVADTLRLAQRLGAESITVPGRDIAESVLAYARDNNITQIMVGKSARPGWLHWLGGSVAHRLVEASGQIGIHVASAEGAGVSAKTVRTAKQAAPFSWRPYILATAAVAATVTLGWTLQFAVGLTSLTSIAMLFLMPVLFGAVRFGLRPALFATFLSVAAYNYFYLPPLHTFTIAAPDNILALIGLLIAAVVTSNLTARMRLQADLAAARAQVAGELFGFAGKLAGSARIDDILWAAAYQISSMLKAGVVILLPDPITHRPEIRGFYPPEDELDDQDIAAAVWCWDHARAAGANSDTLPGARRLFLPMRTGEGPVGVVGLLRAREQLLTPDERRLLDALIDQTALAIERAQLAERIEEAQARAHADKLRAAMLNSLSHDLRTPLASILGAATALRRYPDLHDARQREELLGTVQDEAERLDRFVANLLDISRLEAGALKQRREMLDVADVIGATLRRAAGLLAGYKVLRNIPDDLPAIEGDVTLLEQALFNVFDNAAKYADPGSAVDVSAQVDNINVVIRICDEGPGIAPEESERIFEKFHRSEAADRRAAGTGLGLAVARGFTEAIGGTLTAENRTGRKGAVFIFTFPIVAEQAAHDIA